MIKKSRLRGMTAGQQQLDRGGDKPKVVHPGVLQHHRTRAAGTGLQWSLKRVANNHDQLARRQRHEHLPVGPEEIGDDRHQQPRPQRHQRNKEQQGGRGGPALGVLTLGTLPLAVATRENHSFLPQTCHRRSGKIRRGRFISYS